MGLYICRASGISYELRYLILQNRIGWQSLYSFFPLLMLKNPHQTSIDSQISIVKYNGQHSSVFKHSQTYKCKTSGTTVPIFLSYLQIHYITCVYICMYCNTCIYIHMYVLQYPLHNFCLKNSQMFWYMTFQVDHQEVQFRVPKFRNLSSSSS